MTKPTGKKLSRRDAMKVLGAAIGATALATLPPEWSKPELGAGTLPAHAQTSLHTLACDLDQNIDSNVEQAPITVTSGVTITPPTSGIVMRYSIEEYTAGGDVTSPSPLSGTVNTVSGYAEIDVTYEDFWDDDSFIVTWEFENPANGTGTCDQVFTVPPG